MGAPATFYTIVAGTDIYWRVEVPARVIGATVARIPQESAIRRMRCPKRAGPFPWYVEHADGHPVYLADGEEVLWEHWDEIVDWIHHPRHEGAAVFTRPCDIRAAHARAMQEQGILTVAELDDTLLSPTRLNLFMRQNEWSDEHRAVHLHATATFDRVVFSTARLRDMYVKAWRARFRTRPDTFVCQNHVPLADWPVRDEGNGRLRVGWMGSPQHHRDIKLAYDGLAIARLNGCDVVVMGHDVRDETGVTSKTALEACRAWRSVITRHIPWQDPGKYHRAALPLDIGVAPLEQNEHTLGKSDVKAIEYAISGAVPVLQNHPVYSQHWKHNETCLLAGSRKEFAHCVAELIRSRSLRERLVSAAQAYVREERGDAQIKQEWEAAIAA